jgi:glutamyl-tRNA synthetase
MKAQVAPEIMPALTMMVDRLTALPAWSKEAIHEVLTSTAEVNNLKLGKLAQPVRVAITGGAVSPPIDITMVLIGREQVLERLNRLIDLKMAGEG